MKYQFVGDGSGVPGLPHEITDTEAEELGVSELLQAAVENGSYVVMAESDPHPKINPHPSPLPKGRGSTKE